MNPISKAATFNPDFVEVWGFKWYPLKKIHLIAGQPISPSRNELNYMKRFAIRVGHVLFYKEHELRTYLKNRCSIDRWLQIGEGINEPQEVKAFRYKKGWYIRSSEFFKRFRNWRDRMSKYQVVCCGVGFFVVKKLRLYLKYKNLPRSWIDELIKQYES